MNKILAQFMEKSTSISKDEFQAFFKDDHYDNVKDIVKMAFLHLLTTTS